MAVRPVGESEDRTSNFFQRETQKNSKSEGIRQKTDRNMDFERRTRRNVKHFCFVLCVDLYLQ